MARQQSEKQRIAEEGEKLVDPSPGAGRVMRGGVGVGATLIAAAVDMRMAQTLNPSILINHENPDAAHRDGKRAHQLADDPECRFSIPAARDDLAA
jgi:hypothetical protein